MICNELPNEIEVKPVQRLNAPCMRVSTELGIAMEVNPLQ